MATIAQIRTAVKNKLSGITNFAFVYDQPQATLAGFPAAVIVNIEQSNTVLTNRDNLRTAVVEIALVMEITQKGRSSAEDILDTIVELTMNAFENDLDLSSTIDWTRPVEIKRQTVDLGEGLGVEAMIRLECNYSTALTF